MPTIRHHSALSIEGALKYFKRKSMSGLIQHDDGTPLTDKEARLYLHNLQAQGHKLMCCSSECEGFDPFEKGCPGHPVDDQEGKEEV